MSGSGKNPQAEVQLPPLPLFRPEVIAAQERQYGDVLRIRPFSVLFFAWLITVATAVALISFIAGKPILHWLLARKAP
jgi:hypothetical protein